MRVFQGITGSAGQPAALARGLRRYGINAQSVIIGDNKFSYEADEYIDCSLADWVSIGRYLSGIVDQYDIFHLHMRPFFYWHSSEFHFPSLLDLVILKAAGKRICFHFRGSEVRKASLFRSANKFHYVDEDPNGLFKKFKEPAQVAYVDFISAIADRVFVTDPELQSYVPGSIVVPRVVEATASVRPRPLRDDVPIILHAPSRRGVKGTEFILAAVEQLQREGLQFEFRLVEGRTNLETLNAIADADIVVDQLRIGWYGVLAVEAMALGRVAVSYIRSDLVDDLAVGPSPVVNANPETITDTLRQCILSQKLRKEAARAGGEWFARTHSTEAVMPLLIKEYDTIMHAPKIVDAQAVQSLLEYQAALRARLGLIAHVSPALATAFEKFNYIKHSEGILPALSAVARRLLQKNVRNKG